MLEDKKEKEMTFNAIISFHKQILRIIASDIGSASLTIADYQKLPELSQQKHQLQIKFGYDKFDFNDNRQVNNEKVRLELISASNEDLLQIFKCMMMKKTMLSDPVAFHCQHASGTPIAIGYDGNSANFKAVKLLSKISGTYPLHERCLLYRVDSIQTMKATGKGCFCSLGQKFTADAKSSVVLHHRHREACFNFELLFSGDIF